MNYKFPLKVSEEQRRMLDEKRVDFRMNTLTYPAQAMFTSEKLRQQARVWCLELEMRKK